MTRRTPDESAICCYCKWWRDPEGNGYGHCIAHDWYCWYDEICKCFAKGRVPRKRKKEKTKASKKYLKEMNSDKNLPF